MNMQSRKFGVELEFSSSFDRVKKVISSAFKDNPSIFITDETFHDSNGKKWDLKTDASTECELASPKLSLNSPEFKRLKKIVALLNKNHIKVTEKDGFHIHVHVPDVPLERILAPWMSLENSIKMLYPSSRLCSNGYSQPLVESRDENSAAAPRVSDRLAEVVDKSGEHHSMLSMTHWNDRSTFEFRAHEGTKDMLEIEMSIRFVLRLVEFFKKDDMMDALMRPIDRKPSVNEADGGYLDTDRRGLHFLKKDVLGSDKELVRWVNKRLRKFHRREENG